MQLLHKAARIDVYCNPQELYFKTFDSKLDMNQHMEKQRVASANSERATAHSRGRPRRRLCTTQNKCGI